MLQEREAESRAYSVEQVQFVVANNCKTTALDTTYFLARKLRRGRGVVSSYNVIICFQLEIPSQIRRMFEEGVTKYL